MTTTVHVPTDAYAVDRVHSSIGFGVKYNKLATFRSSFANFDASLRDGVLTGSVDVGTIEIDEPNFKGHLMTAEFFDADTTPTIEFRSTDIRAAADGSAEVEGELTIRGATRSVSASGSFAVGADAWGNERVAFELSTTIDRREYGLSWQNTLPDGSDALAWDVTINVDLQLVKQA